MVHASELQCVERALRAERRLTDDRFRSIDERFEIMNRERDWRFKDTQWHIDFARKRADEDRRFARGQWFIATGFVLLAILLLVYEFLV